MNTNREYILSKLTINGVFDHYCFQQKWYDDNIELLNLIYKETSFLPHDALINERLYCIYHDINDIIICPFCNINKLKFKFFKHGYLNTCGDTKCKVLSGIKNKKPISDEKRIKINEKISKANKQKFINMTDEERDKFISISRKNFFNCRKYSQTEEAKKKRVESRRKNNKYWHTKETIHKISKSNKITHLSAEFKDKYKKTYELAHQKQSIEIKERIKNGKFTPCITNTWTHFDAIINIDNINYKFRSSWEVVFWFLNQHLEYEKIRIPYTFENQQYIYIVDFVDTKNKIIYEIKPNSYYKKNIQNKLNAKTLAAQAWCKSNNYEYKIISDDWFILNAKRFDYNSYPQYKSKMKKFLTV